MKFLMIVTAFLPAALSMGINCHGAPACVHGPDEWAILKLLDYVHTNISPHFEDTVYEANERIMCWDKFCAFFQNTNGTMVDVYLGLRELADQGCAHCGSAPTKLGGNVSTGELTVGWTWDSCGDKKVCYPVEDHEHDDHPWDRKNVTYFDGITYTDGDGPTQ